LVSVSVGALRSSLSSSLGTAASASAALGITVVSDPSIVSGGKCQGWYVVRPYVAPYSAAAADCQQLCSLSAACGATSFTSQGDKTYCYMHFQLSADCTAAEALYGVKSSDSPSSCDANLGVSS